MSFLSSLSFIQQLFSLSGSLSSSSVTWWCLRPWIPLTPDFFFLNARTGWKGGEMARLYLNPESQSASCIIMRKDISIHTRLLLSLCTFVLPARRNTFIPSAWWYGPLHCFPHTSSFIPLLPQNSHTMPLFCLPSLFSVNTRVPCFPLGCPVGCVNVPCQLYNIISWVVASCSVPLHNLPAPVLPLNEGPFFSAFLRHKYDPLMEMALS